MVLMTLIAGHAWSQVVINEIMSSNSFTISDEDGEFADWIELYNTSENEVNLLGYGLSDNENNPFKWVLPNVTIAPKGFLLIWASGKDRKNINQPLHTNYSISAAGEEILLSHPEGFVIDEIPPMAIPTDVSYGRQPDGTENLVFFDIPTPNQPNDSNGFTEFLSKPEIIITAPNVHTISLQINNPNQKGIILYTLDGSVPSLEAFEQGRTFKVDYYFEGENETNVLKNFEHTTFTYEDPVELDLSQESTHKLSDIITTYNRDFEMHWQKPSENHKKGMAIRATIYHNGRYSPVSAKTYFPSEVVETHHLPILSLIVDNEDLFGYEEGLYVPGKRFIENGGSPNQYILNANYRQSGRPSEKPVSLELYQNSDLVFSQGLGLRIHGSGSRTRPIKSFRLYARNDYDQQAIIDFPFIPNSLTALGNPLTSYKRLLFRQGGDRLDYLTDAVLHRIMEPMYLGLQRSAPMVHYINGEYWGLITARDRIDRYFVGDNYNIDPDNVVMIDSPWGEGSSAMVDEGSPSDIQYYRELRNLILNTDLSEDGSFETIAEKLDILSYIDHVVAFVYWNNVDWYGDKHFRIWRSTQTNSSFDDGKFRFIVWDFDAALTNGAGFNTLINWIDPKGGGNEFATNDPEKTRILRTLLQNSAFKNLFLNRFNDLINSAFKPERISAISNDYYAGIEPEFERHFARWNFYPSSTNSLYGYKNYLNRFHQYAQDRPNSQRAHLREAFGLEENLIIQINVRELESGFVNINTLSLDENLAGTGGKAYPWEGTYFKNIPITLEAKAHVGYKFDFWLINGEQYKEEQLEYTPSENLQILAVFTKDDVVVRELMYYWYFDTNIANDTPLLSISPAYSAIDHTSANMRFEPAIHPYPLNEGNSAGIMDRVNDPTSINFIDEPADGLTLDMDKMRGIRTRNPLMVIDGETSRKGYLIFDIPADQYKDLLFKAAVSRTNNGPLQLKIAYSTQEDESFVALPRELSTFDLNPDFNLLELDLTSLAEINANKHFKLRIGFEGNTSNTSGNARFNNISISGSKAVESPGSIESDTDERIILLTFPNPSSNDVMVLLNRNRIDEVIDLQVINMQGQDMFSHSSHGDDYIKLDIRTWLPGTYILRAVTSKKVEITRIIKR